MNAFGIDVSAYNGQMDWGKAKAHNVSFAGMRATISWGYRDKWLPHNLYGAKQQNIERMCYHVLYPGESVTRQVDNFAKSVGEWEDIAPVIDVELDHGYGKNVITAAIISIIHETQGIIGKEPIIYSRAQWINTFTLPGEWRQTVKWWLAQYYDRTKEDTRPPDLPFGVSNWLIHQNADKYPQFCNGPDGISTVDTNRWNGDEAAMRAWFHPTPPEPPNPVHGTEIGYQPAVIQPRLRWVTQLDEWARNQGFQGDAPQ